MPNETAERNHLARTVLALCKEAEEAERAYIAADAAGDDALADAINGSSARRLDEIARLVGDLADRPVRNLQDVELGTSALLCYFQARWGDDARRVCPFIRGLERIGEFAQRASKDVGPQAAVFGVFLLCYFFC